MMINLQPRRDASVHEDLLLVRALSSITLQQTSAIAHAVHTASAHAWTTEAFDDYDGYRSILIEPRMPHSRSACYLVSGIAQCLDLFEVGEDQLVPVGCFSGDDDLTGKLIDLIAGQ